MRKIFAALLIACTCGNAANAGEWLPTTSLRASFGGAAAPQFALSLGTAYLDPEVARPLPLTDVLYQSGSGADAKLLGVSLRAGSRILHADGSEGPSTWGWIGTTVAVLGTLGLIAAAAGDNDEKDGPGNDDDGPNCNIFGGNVPGGPIYVVGPECEFFPGGGLPPLEP